MVVHVLNPITQEAEADEALWDQSNPVLHGKLQAREMLSQIYTLKTFIKENKSPLNKGKH